MRNVGTGDITGRLGTYALGLVLTLMKDEMK